MGRRVLLVFVGMTCFLVSGSGADAGAVNRTASRAAAQANLALIHAPAARLAASDCSGAVVAVLDSGVDAGNPHLAGSVLPGWNVLTNSTNTTDTAGHGTKVSGVIAGHSGITGLCRVARILPVVVWTKDRKPTESSIVAGIRWAAAHGATVINLSLGGTQRSAALRKAIGFALGRDVVVVAAAGNSGLDSLEYPAAYPGVVAVSGIDSTGSLAPFSSFGDWITLAAPAMHVLTTKPGGAIVMGDGTSFASPLVAAAAALVRTQHPAWTNTQVVRRLEQSADDAGLTGLDPAFGHGILDVAAAVGATRPVRAPVGQVDRFEPDNLPADAAPLAVGAKLGATLSPEGDTDWYAIDVHEATQVVLGATASAGVSGRHTSLIVDILGPGLRQLAHRDARWDSRAGALAVSFPAAAPGRYFVRVANAYGSRGAYRLSVSHTSLSPWAAWEDVYTGAEGAAVATGDVTGDGRTDVVMATTSFATNRYAGQLLLFAQRRDGTLAAPVILPRGARFCCGDVAVGDLNGDGRLDVAATLGANGVETFLQRNGKLTGPVVVSTASAATGVRISGGHLDITEVGSAGAPGGTPSVRADLDRDGRSDFVSGNTIHYASGKVERDGCDVTGIGSHTLAAGDVNGDGRTDLVWAGPFGLVVVRQRSEWSAPGAWVAAARDGAVLFARPVNGASLSARTVSVLDAHGNRIPAGLSFDAATNTLTIRAASGAQIRIAGIRDTAGNVLPSAFTSNF